VNSIFGLSYTINEKWAGDSDFPFWSLTVTEQNNQSEGILYVHNNWAEGMCIMYHSHITHNNITIHVNNKKTTLHLQQGKNTDSVGSSGCPVTSALLCHQPKPSPCLRERSALLFFTVVMIITDFHKTYHISQ